jgi:hypothetical protein
VGAEAFAGDGAEAEAEAEADALIGSETFDES